MRSFHPIDLRNFSFKISVKKSRSSAAADEKKKKLIAQRRKAGKPQRTGLGDVNYFFHADSGEKTRRFFVLPKGLSALFFFLSAAEKKKNNSRKGAKAQRIPLCG